MGWEFLLNDTHYDTRVQLLWSNHKSNIIAKSNSYHDILFICKQLVLLDGTIFLEINQQRIPHHLNTNAFTHQRCDLRQVSFRPGRLNRSGRVLCFVRVRIRVWINIGNFYMHSFQETHRNFCFTKSFSCFVYFLHKLNYY